MNKVIGIVVVIAAVAAGAWYFTRTPEGEMAADKAAETATGTAQDAGAAASDAAATAVDAVKDAADKAGTAVKDAASTAGAAATDAAQAVGDAAGAAVQGAGDAAGAAVDAAKATTETVTGAAGDASALSVENFDADKVSAMIDASALPDTMKASLKASVEAARTNPALVQGAVDQVKAALGM